MTFVFEAQRLPLSDNAAPLCHSFSVDGVDDALLSSLPRWKRRLLPPVLQIVQQLYAKEDEETRAWQVALRIVDELQELEVAFDRIIEVRERQRTGTMTAEERMLEELMRERMGDAYLADDAEESEEEEEAGEEEIVDIAMSFSADGEVLGIGSASMLGRHGYHPQ